MRPAGNDAELETTSLRVGTELRLARSVLRAEIVALALLSVLPVVPYLVFTLGGVPPRFSVAGDFALLEQAARHVWSGDTLLGPYSRFRWHHPGPLFFFVTAPFLAVFGKSSTGLFVAPCVINASAAASIVTLARRSMTRAHGIAALLVVLAWFAAFGNVSASPWNPLVIVLPLVAFLVAAAVLVRGDSRGLVPAAFFGALAASSHVAAVPTVLAVGLVAATRFGAVARERGLTARGRRRLLGAAVILLVALVPPLVEQVIAERGNISALVRFFLNRDVPPKPLGTVFQNAVQAVSWLPDRLLDRALPDEGWIVLGMRWDPLPNHLTPTARALAFVHVVAIALASWVATRRRDWTSLYVLGAGVLGEISALMAIRSIQGEDFYYLIFWTTAASTVAWFGVVSTLLRAVASRVRRLPERAVAFAVGVGLVTLAAHATSYQQRWLRKNPSLPGLQVSLQPLLEPLHTALLQRLARDGTTPVLHLEGAHDMAQGILLELERDGIDVRVPEAEHWNYFGIRTPDSTTRPQHIWFSTNVLPLSRTTCLELIAESGDVRMFTGSPDLRCP